MALRHGGMYSLSLGQSEGSGLFKSPSSLYILDRASASVLSESGQYDKTKLNGVKNSAPLACNRLRSFAVFRYSSLT